MAYDVALICTNGHLINSQLRAHHDLNPAYCSTCGQPTISKCPDCNHDIKGLRISEFSYIFTYTVPAYCEYCGQPFPWTKSALESAALIIQEDENLSEQLKESVAGSLSDVIVENPKTNLAVVRLQKCLSTAGKFTADAVRQFVIDFGCELAKKSMGL